MKKVIVSGLFVLVLACASLVGQGGLGALNGVVTDSTQANMPRVTVVIRNVATGVETRAMTNDSGQYRFDGLVVGSYVLTASQTGFQTVERKDLRVVTGETLTVDILLPVRAEAQSVTVTATAIDTTSTHTNTTIVAQEIEDLPVQLTGTNRNVRDFLGVLPGMMARDGAPDNLNHAQVQGVGDGGGSRSVSGYKVDGIAAGMGVNQQMSEGRGQVPIPEQVEEMRVVSNEDAEYGGGFGTTVELILKSGTNNFHGGVFGFLRNEALDARLTTAARASFDRQQEFGGAVGGPIRKNKHFFFFTYNGYRRQFAQAGSTQSVPTVKMRQGDFSEWLGAQIGTDVLGRPVFTGQIYNPATTRSNGAGGFIRDPFPGNIMPAGTRISPIADYLQKYYPLPTRAGVQLNWVGVLENQKLPRTGWNIKTDHDFGPRRLSLFFEQVLNERAPDAASFLPKEIGGTRNLDQQAVAARVNFTWMIRPNLLYVARMGLLLGTFTNGPGEPNSTVGRDAGIRGTLNPTTPQVTLGGIVAGMGAAQPVANGGQQTTPVRMDLSWTKGNHATKFGAEFLQVSFGQLTENATNGVFNFAVTGTNLPLSALNTGNAYASYLLGQVNSATLTTPTATRYTAQSWAFYGQDKWRATSNLTINYGLRWDIFVTPHEGYNRIASFDPTVPNPGAGGIPGALTFWGDGPGRNGRRNLTDTVFTNFQPRLGIAYRLGPKTAIRAYYGLQFFPMTALSNGGRTLPNFGWGATRTPSSLDNGVTPAFNWDNGFPSLIPPLPTLDPTLQNGTTITYWNPREPKVGTGQGIGLSIEREFPWRLYVKAAYLGRLMHNLPTDQLVGVNQLPLRYLSLGSLLSQNITSAAARAANIPIPYAGFTGTVQQALRPFPQYLNIAQANAMVGDNLYHALYLTVQKRFGHGLHFLMSYTISKQLVNDALAGTGGGTGAVDIPHSDLRSLGKTVSYLMDRPQIFSLSWGYDLPFGPGKRWLRTTNPILRQFGGWKIAGVHNYAAGVPFRILGASGIPFGGPALVNYLGPAQIRTGTACGDYDTNDPNSRLLNINAFAEPAQFAIGNTRVLPNIRSCGTQNESLTISKRFLVKEGVNVEFGASAFNVLNRHNWRGFTTSINVPQTFGRSTIVSAPRTMQVRLKVNF